MSWFTDWYIANESEAEALVIAFKEDQEEPWPHIWFKNIGTYEFEWLRHIIHGVDDFLSGPDLNPSGRLLYETEDKEIGVFRVKDEFIDELANINHDEIDKLAEAWAQSEPMLSWGWLPSDLVEDIWSLTDFAAQAKRLNTPVLEMYII